MLRFMLLAQLIYPTVEIMDSRTNDKMMFIIINHSCKVEVEKAKIHDIDYMQEKVDDQCGDIPYMKDKNVGDQ